MGHHRWECVIQLQWDIIVGSVYSIAVGHQRWKFVIQLQWDISIGSVLFNCSGTSALVVFYLIAVGHQRW